MLINFSKFSLYLNMLPEFSAALLIYDPFWLLKFPNCVLFFLCVKLVFQMVVWKLILCHLDLKWIFGEFSKLVLLLFYSSENLHFQSVVANSCLTSWTPNSLKFQYVYLSYFYYWVWKLQALIYSIKFSSYWETGLSIV